MKAIKQKIHGRIVDGEESGLLLDESANPIYLRYAFVTLGPEEHILPAFLLDDWGKEIKGLKLYSWVQDNGLYFPRAEIFGFYPSGKKAQIFLRELDLVLKYRCYVYEGADVAIEDGRLVETFFIPDPSITEPTPTKRPLHMPKLLSKSAVSWVKIPA